MRDWEKGSRNLADLAESEPGSGWGGSLLSSGSQPVSMSEPLMPAKASRDARPGLMLCPA